VPAEIEPKCDDVSARAKPQCCDVQDQVLGLLRGNHLRELRTSSLTHGQLGRIITSNVIVLARAAEFKGIPIPKLHSKDISKVLQSEKKMDSQEHNEFSIVKLPIYKMT
jgi:hypothetical protein